MTITRPTYYANAATVAFLNELEVLWHDEPLAIDPAVFAAMATPQAPPRTPAIREAFAPLDSYPIEKNPERRPQLATPFLSVRQAP